MLKPLLAWWRGEQQAGPGDKVLKDSDQEQAGGGGKEVGEVGSQSEGTGNSVR